MPRPRAIASSSCSRPTAGPGSAADELRRDGGLGERRLEEARRSSEALGVARVEWLGYADSGSGAEPEPDVPGTTRFCRAPVEEAAERLAAVLRTERADLLLSYDANGGYGHRDHVRVHAGRRAGRARSPAPRGCSRRRCRATRSCGRCGRSAASTAFPTSSTPTSFERAFSARSEITHRVDVRRYAGAKRAAMRAHASQATGGGAASAGDGGQTGDRTLAAFLRIPRPVYDLVFGREWFRDPALPPGRPVRTDIFEGGAMSARTRQVLQTVIGLGLAAAHAHLGPAVLREDLVGRHLERHPHHPPQPRRWPSRR